jgi:DNA-binding NarL/FixJ family response regulator
MTRQKNYPKTGKLRAGTDELVTPQEKALLEMLAQGMANKDIAAKLGVADETIKSYIAKLYKRFGAQTRNQLLSYAANHNVIASKGFEDKSTPSPARNR